MVNPGLIFVIALLFAGIFFVVVPLASMLGRAVADQIEDIDRTQWASESFRKELVERYDARAQHLISKGVMSAPGELELEVEDEEEIEEPSTGQNIPRQAWDDLIKEMDEAVRIIGSYEMDPMKAIDYPAFNDLRVPEVKAMVQSLKRASRVRNRVEWDSFDPTDGSLFDTFTHAVDDLTTSVSAAERTARTIRWSNMSTKEREYLSKAKNLFKQASDPGNPKAFRSTLYQQLYKVVRKLNEEHGAEVLPARAMGSLERAAAKAISTSRTTHSTRF